jgi:hypothetical protein
MRDVVEDGPVEGCTVGAGLGAGEEFGGRGHSIFRGARARCSVAAGSSLRLYFLTEHVLTVGLSEHEFIV